MGIKKEKKGAEENKRAAEDGDGKDSDEEEGGFWFPTWDTLGPMEEVKKLAQRNKYGRVPTTRGDDFKDFGFGLQLTKTPTMRSKKAIVEEEAEKKKHEKGRGESRRAKHQKARRQRKLAEARGEVVPPIKKKETLLSLIAPASAPTLEGADKKEKVKKANSSQGDESDV